MGRMDEVVERRNGMTPVMAGDRSDGQRLIVFALTVAATGPWARVGSENVVLPSQAW